MSTVQHEAQIFSKAASSLPRAMASLMHKEALELRAKFQERSPVYFGVFKRSWRTSKSGKGVIAGFTIFNPISYGRFIEFGVDPVSKHVWARHFANSRVSSRAARNSRLTKKDGRIWSKHAVGGVIGPIVTPTYENELTQRVANEVIKVIV